MWRGRQTQRDINENGTKHTKNGEKEMTWDRFDIIEAYYLYARQYHEGQRSKEYKIFGRIAKLGFFPNMSLKYSDDPSVALSENGVEIFEKLVKRGL